VLSRYYRTQSHRGCESDAAATRAAYNRMTSRWSRLERLTSCDPIANEFAWLHKHTQTRRDTVLPRQVYCRCVFTYLILGLELKLKHDHPSGWCSVSVVTPHAVVLPRGKRKSPIGRPPFSFLPTRLKAGLKYSLPVSPSCLPPLLSMLTHPSRINIEYVVITVHSTVQLKPNEFDAYTPVCEYSTHRIRGTVSVGTVECRTTLRQGWCGGAANTTWNCTTMSCNPTHTPTTPDPEAPRHSRTAHATERFFGFGRVSACYAHILYGSTRGDRAFPDKENARRVDSAEHPPLILTSINCFESDMHKSCRHRHLEFPNGIRRKYNGLLPHVIIDAPVILYKLLSEPDGR
jgi:hypothetical protein